MEEIVIMLLILMLILILVIYCRVKIINSTNNVYSVELANLLNGYREKIATLEKKNTTQQDVIRLTHNRIVKCKSELSVATENIESFTKDLEYINEPSRNYLN